MKPINTSRLQALRAENDAAGIEQQQRSARFRALEKRHEHGTAPRAISAHQLFQTPPALAARLVALLGDITGSRVLEPSAGLGRILDALAPGNPSEVVAIELAQDCARELYGQQRDTVKLLQRDFLSVFPDEIGHFDFIAMNPPFTMRSDIRHIEHALDFLKPGGTVAALMLATDHRRNHFREMASTWEEIPAGAFRSENTNAPTILFSVKQ